MLHILFSSFCADLSHFPIFRRKKSKKIRLSILLLLNITFSPKVARKYSHNAKMSHEFGNLHENKMHISSLLQITAQSHTVHPARNEEILS